MCGSWWDRLSSDFDTCNLKQAKSWVSTRNTYTVTVFGRWPTCSCGRRHFDSRWVLHRPQSCRVPSLTLRCLSEACHACAESQSGGGWTTGYSWSAPWPAVECHCVRQLCCLTQQASGWPCETSRRASRYRGFRGTAHMGPVSRAASTVEEPSYRILLISKSGLSLVIVIRKHGAPILTVDPRLHC